MYFLNLDKDSPEEESNKIIAVLNEIIAAPCYNDCKIIEFDDEARLIPLESRLDALEKLKNNGAVQDWEIVNSSNDSGKIIVSRQGLNLNKNIRGYRELQNTYEALKKGITAFEFSNINLSLQSRQLALYKLAILGIVRDWTIKRRSLTNGTLIVRYDEIDIENMKKFLINYIHKHDAEFSLDGKITEYKQYTDLIDKYSKNPLKGLIMVLVTWTNNTILYNRLQSSRNMMYFCSKEVTDTDFREKINDFFKYTEQTVVFDAIVQYPKIYQNWFDILTFQDNSGKMHLINRNKAESTSNSLLRYLESYGNNTGLNYLSGMLRLICGNYEGTEGEERLLDSLQNIKESMANTNEEREIIERTLQIASELELKEKNMFSETLLKVYPELIDHVHETLQDIYSLSLIVDNKTTKINKILEAKINGLFKTT